MVDPIDNKNRYSPFFEDSKDPEIMALSRRVREIGSGHIKSEDILTPLILFPPSVALPALSLMRNVTTSLVGSLFRTL